MKKIYFLVTSLLLLTGYAAQSQCNNTAAFGIAAAPTFNTTPTTITTCAFAGEYSTITGATAGATYLFNATGGAGNFITIRQGTPGGTVLGFGVAPISVTCTVSGDLFLHYNTNAACGTDASCHTGTVQCTSCPPPPPPPDPCTSIVNIPACATPVTTVHNGAGVWNVTTCGFSTPGQERVYSFTPATTGLYNLNVTAVPIGGFLDYYWKLQSAGCGPTGWTCIDDNAAVGTDPIGILTAGIPIYILVDDESTAPTTHTFNISCAIVGPPNDLCAGAIALPCNGSVSGTTVGSTIDAVGTCVTALNTAGGVWYTFVGNGAPNTISTCTGTAYDSKIGVFSGACGSLVCVTGNDDACGLQSSVTFTANAGTTYFVLVTGFGAATGAFTLTRTSILPNDLCTGAITINCGQTINGSTACGASIDAAAGTCVTSLNTAPGVWYTFVGDASPVTLSLCGSSYDTKIGVFTGTCTGLVCVTGNDDFCGLQSQVTFPTNGGFTYYILVTGFGSATGTFTLTRTCAPPCAGVPSPGSITPATTTACRGASTTLTAAGYSPNSALSFQWNQAPAAAGPYTTIPGATSNVYTATPTVTTYYTVTVTCTNGGGAATTSPPVVINVDGISHINVSATPSTLCAGGSTTITGTAVNGILLPTMVVVANSGTINLAIPDANPTGASHTMAVPAGIINTIPADLRIRVNMVHTWVGDLAIRITSPCGTTFLFDRPGTTGAGFGNADDINGVYTFDVSAATIIPETTVGGLIPAGSYRPSDAAGNPNPTWSPLTFPCAATGNWTITGIDLVGGDVGIIRDWQILAPSPSNYTHTLTGGAGTITQNASTGVANATGNFTVTNIPAGNQVFTLTSTDPFGCSIATPVNVTVNPIPNIVITAGTPSTSTVSYTGPAVAVPDNVPAGVNIPLAVSGLSGTINDLNFRLDAGAGTCDATTGNTNASMDHTFNGDLVFSLTSPGGTTVVLINRRGGGGNNFCTVLLDDDGGFPATSTMSTAGAIAGNFAPENPLSAFDGQNPNGTWTLNVSDNANIDIGSLRRFSLLFTTSSPNATICNGQNVPINAYAVPGSTTQTYSSSCVINVPGTGTVGNGSPYPCVVTVGGLPPAGVTVQSVRINNYNHTFPDDVDLVLVSPTGTPVILMSDAGGAAPATGQIFTFRDGAAALADNAFNPTGTYRPTNYLTPDNFPAPGPGSLTQAAPALSSFAGNANGNWSLYAVDDLTGSTGIIGGWSITFNIPAPVVFSPTTNLFTDAALTTPYTAGTPVYTVWAAPTATTTYTVTANVFGCINTATSTITVNQLPAITAQPTPASQTICPGFTVSYSVAATGTGLTYQWQYNPGSGFVNLVNGGFISGATSTTLTIANVQLANAGSYRVIVSGTCTPAATSNTVVLNVGSAPTISTQPANTTLCEGSNGTLTVVAAGTPTPTIFQWQVSTDGGVTWTNLTTGGSYTATLTLTNVTLAMNNNRYRVIITNSCGMTITSNVITLTVNARPVIAITPLPTRICLSDTLVPLVASPTGGSWTGIGVSGFNFVPTATAVGTYTLTYTFTSAAGCTNTATAVAKVESCPERIRLLSNDAVILFPNPNNGRFNIRINSTLYNVLGMKVYDMAGRLMNGKVVKNGTDQALVSPTFTGLVYGRVIPIDISNLAAGTYLVKFYYDDGIRSSEKGFLVVVQK